MSMDASLSVFVPLARVDESLDVIRGLAARVDEGGSGCGSFTISVEKSGNKSAYFSTRPKFWQADMIVDRGTEFAEIIFFCPTTNDGMELVIDKSPILQRIAQTLETTGLIGGYISSDGERVLLTNRLTFSGAKINWEDIPDGVAGIDALAAACSQNNT